MSINFSGNRLQQVLDGLKTRTWRPLKGGETFNLWRIENDIVAETRETSDVVEAYALAEGMSGWRVGDIKMNGRVKWALLQTHAIGQGRGKPSVRVMRDGVLHQPRIRIVRIALSRPLYTTMSEAAAEGFNTADEFREVLRDLYGQRFDMRAIGIALEWSPQFEMVATEGGAS